MKEELIKLKAANKKMMEMLGLDQSENKESVKTLVKKTESSFTKRRRIEEEETLDSLLEGLKKKGKRIKK